MTYEYDLSGIWSFRLDNEQQGLQAHFEKSSFTDSMMLPSTTSIAKKGIPNPEVKVDSLTEEYKTEGFAWFRRTLTIAPEAVGQHAILYLERTRISHIWVDGVYVGSQNSICSAHTYDLTDYLTSNHPELTIMTSNVGYPVKGGHMTSPDTQTNWNGIMGKMTLTFYQTDRITSVRTDCNYDSRTAEITVFYEHYTDGCDLAISCFGAPVTLDTYHEEASYTALAAACRFHAEKGTNECRISVTLPASFPVWDEYDPAVISLKTELHTISSDALSSTDSPVTAEGTSNDTFLSWFGIRKFEARGTHFYINDRKTFLRGKHDGMIFPLTGAAPMDTDSWIQTLSTAKKYGINHYRCHTCCPPEAAFIAADLLGIFYEPELPFWGTFTTQKDEGHDEAGQQYLIQEGFHILDAFGNHPSFCMISMGNELWGSPEAINELLGRYKAHDDRHLYTQGSNNFQWVPNIQSNDDFFSGVRFTIDRQIRGSYAMCDQPLGHVQTDRPCTDFNYEDAIFPKYNVKTSEISADGTIEIQYGTGIKKVKLTDVQEELIPKVPVVSHEIGQYETYPDFDEIQKYTGVLKARNFEAFRARLQEKGLLSLAKDYFHSSGALAVACYKDELETALRTKDMAGFQILDLQDFSGQGTALVGVLDAFMENKGIVTDADFREFCSDAVIQAEFPSYLLTNGTSLEATVSLTWYRKELPAAKNISYTLTDSNTAAVIAAGMTEVTTGITENGYHIIGSLRLPIPESDTPQTLTLRITLDGTDVSNYYEFWSYPAYSASDVCTSYAASADSDTYAPASAAAIYNCVTSDFVQAIKRTQAGSPVILCLSKEQNPNSITGTYATDFWCYPMFRSISESMKKEIPVGTMGLLIQDQHPALAKFPTHRYSSPQWWDIVMNSASTILDQTQIQPVVQTIDNFERNHRLGLIYEVQIAGTHAPIIICTSPLQQLIQEGHPEAQCLLDSLCSYAQHLSYYPAHEIVSMTEGEFYNLFNN